MIQVDHGTVSHLLLTLLPSIPNNALPTPSPTITTKIIANRQPAPLHMLVCGTAGTGKSYLIRAIAHTLGNTCLLTATTGKASFNICGRTVHSASKLPKHQSNKQDLQGSSLQRLQLKMKGIHYIIIDEMSMIGHQMLASDKQVANSMNQLVIFQVSSLETLDNFRWWLTGLCMHLLQAVTYPSMDIPFTTCLPLLYSLAKPYDSPAVTQLLNLSGTSSHAERWEPHPR